MTSNLYKVGDWVYCEVSPYQPYVIRKIEELTKTQCGNVEAKVICAFRGQEIPPAIMATVEKYQANSKAEAAADGVDKAAAATNAENTGATKEKPTSGDFAESEVSDLNEQQRYNLKHREVYFSKYTDTIAATTIRSKCSVLLFNEEIERYSDYLNKDDSFYYHLTYDPYQKSIVADKGEIRVGHRYQTEIPVRIKVTPNGSILEDPNGSLAAKQSQELERNDRVLRSQLQKMTSNGGTRELDQPEVPMSVQSEELLWLPCEQEITLSSAASYYGITNKLDDRDIDKFLLLAKSVGTFARALDCNNAFKQPSLPLSAAAASRDITLFHAMNTLHENNYDIGKACLSLITSNGPYLCKDEMEEWSPSEANLFEDALDKLGKDFIEIRKEYLPWKCLKSIIEYYYTWKTTDRYVQQKKIKSTEQESKLKQVFIPNHSKQSALIKSGHVQLFNHYDVHLKPSCESCGTPNTSTNQWYVYNPSTLVQLIMTGNTNQTVLSNAAAQAQAANSSANGHGISQARFCTDCWMYWKKFSSFKYPNARQERLNQLKNQLHKCSVNGCGKEFKLKQLLVKHCGIAHGYFAKPQTPVGQNNQRPPPIRNRTAFYLYTTPMTKAARFVCTGTIKLNKLARKPFKLVELSDLNKEWTKLQNRNITQILEENKKAARKSKKLDVKLISVISKTRVKLLKQKRSENNGLTNGHAIANENHDMEEVNEDGEEFINDCHNDISEKPEFFKYFGNKCSSPCYVPESLAFPKLTSDQINKFHLNLMSQNRKRPHDQSQTSNGENGGNASQTNGGSGSNDSSPLSKRTLMSDTVNNGNSKNTAQNLKNNTATNNNLKTTGSTNSASVTKQTVRASQKANKPQQAINRANSPEDIYYQINTHLNQLRHEVQVVALRKLARKPYKLLANEYQGLYQTFGKLSDKVAKGKGNEVELSGDEKKKDNDEVMLVVESDEKTNENSNDKNDLVVDEEIVEDSKKSTDDTPAPEVVID